MIPVPRSISKDCLLLLPLTIFFVFFVFAPLCLLGFVSFHNDAGFKEIGVGQYTKFFTDQFNLAILVQTLWLGVKTTLLAIAIGYPLAYIYAVSSKTLQRILILAILLPLLTSAVVRTFGWIVILGRQGIINSTLLAAGIVDSPVALLYTEWAVVVALAQIEMPLMVLPIANALTNIASNLSQASLSLGAGRWRTFYKIILPLSMPGLLAGCLLVFAASVSAFITQTLIGGGQLMFMPLYIYQQANQANNYPYAAAIAVSLLLSVLLIVTVINFIGRRSKGYVNT
jgi:putative spermidine/putrescine transport system permease protein